MAAVQGAHDRVLDLVRQRRLPDGTATTLVAAVHLGDDVLVVVNVGDSPAWLLTPQGPRLLAQLHRRWDPLRRSFALLSAIGVGTVLEPSVCTLRWGRACGSCWPPTVSTTTRRRPSRRPRCRVRNAAMCRSCAGGSWTPCWPVRPGTTSPSRCWTSATSARWTPRRSDGRPRRTRHRRNGPREPPPLPAAPLPAPARPTSPAPVSAPQHATEPAPPPPVPLPAPGSAWPRRGGPSVLGKSVVALAAVIAVILVAAVFVVAERNQRSAGNGTAGSTTATSQVTSAGPVAPLAELHGETAGITNAAFSPDAATLVTAGAAVWRWNVASGTPIGQRLAVTAGTVTSVAWSPDGKWLATASSDGQVRLWDVGKGKQLGAVQVGGKVTSVAFGLDGKRLATGGEDGQVRLWEVAAGGATAKPLGASLSPSLSGARSPAWRSAWTGSGWPPAVRTVRCGCGRWRRAGRRPSRSASSLSGARSPAWRSARTGGGWPPAAMTVRCGCGTSRPVGRSRGSRSVAAC